MEPHDLTPALRRILASARSVGSAMGPGADLEQYEAALDRSMRAVQLQFARQYPIGVPFYGPRDRGFYADFIVEGRILLELMHMPALDTEATDLALNYLCESGADICLLINFGRVPIEIRRILPSGNWTDERVTRRPGA
ncbi:MAG TPA: GxxExxY protein [Anaerolineales bacterium]|nr:GxxExxY protein [Anaerolineales bacterium]